MQCRRPNTRFQDLLHSVYYSSDACGSLPWPVVQRRRVREMGRQKASASCDARRVSLPPPSLPLTSTAAGRPCIRPPSHPPIKCCQPQTRQHARPGKWNKAESIQSPISVLQQITCRFVQNHLHICGIHNIHFTLE